MVAKLKESFHVLGLQSTANGSAIKEAYRAKILKHHPDKGGSTEKFSEIYAAYENLKHLVDDASKERKRPPGFDKHVGDAKKPKPNGAPEPAHKDAESQRIAQAERDRRGNKPAFSSRFLLKLGCFVRDKYHWSGAVSTTKANRTETDAFAAEIETLREECNTVGKMFKTFKSYFEDAEEQQDAFDAQLLAADTHLEASEAWRMAISLPSARDLFSRAMAAQELALDVASHAPNAQDLARDARFVTKNARLHFTHAKTHARRARIYADCALSNTSEARKYLLGRKL